MILMLKKIETQAERAKKQQKRNLVIGMIIIFLMVFSSLGYVIVENNSSPEQGIKYGNYTFIPAGSAWQTNLSSFGMLLTTTYLPGDVLDVNGSKADLFYVQDKIIYLDVSSQQDIQASIDLIRNLEPISSRMQFACSKENENSSFCIENNYPIKNCEEADSSSLIIIINSTNLNKGYEFKESCLVVNGQGSDIIKASDNFVFKLFRIIE